MQQCYNDKLTLALKAEKAYYENVDRCFCSLEITQESGYPSLSQTTLDTPLEKRNLN